MDKTIFWQGGPLRLEEAEDRRRRALPIAALAAQGWRSLLLPDCWQEAGIAVLSGNDPGDADIALGRAARGLPVVLNPIRGSRPDPLMVRLSNIVVGGPDHPPVIGVGARFSMIPDTVETLDQMIRLAGFFDHHPANPPCNHDVDILWYANSLTGVEAELAVLVALLPTLRRHRRHLTLVLSEEMASNLPSALATAPDVVILRGGAWLGLACLARSRLLLLPGVPGSGNDHQLTRARSALAHGVPVVACSGAAMDYLGSSGALILDDWERGLLQPPESTAPIIQHMIRQGALPTMTAIGREWDRLLSGLLTMPVQMAGKPHKLMIFMDLIQDTDLCLPLIAAARDRADLVVNVVVTSWLLDASPRIGRALAGLGVTPQVVDRRAVYAGTVPSLEGVDSVLTPVSTTHNAHKRAFALTERAKAAGIPTYSMQHGLENIGLTYFDDPAEIADINTDWLLTWFPPEHMPAQVPAALRSKLAHVGCVKPVPLACDDFPTLPSGRRIGVFENLHWNRYDDPYRQDFVRALRQSARRAPDILFILKPHHGGRWLAKNNITDWPDNVIMADPQDPIWEPHTAPDIIAHVDAVITTPSTVAFDACRGGKPTAVVGGRLHLSMFEPLPILRQDADWLDFCRLAAGGTQGATSREIFLRRSMLPGVASQRALNFILAGSSDAARLTIPTS